MSLPVCGSCPSTTGGCVHTNPMLAPSVPPHVCQKPELYLIGGRQHWWECGICGREWRPTYSGSLAWWEETRGPTQKAGSAP